MTNNVKIYVAHHMDDALPEQRPQYYSGNVFEHVDTRQCKDGQLFDECSVIPEMKTEADFIGLCHYRRVLLLPSFLDKKVIYCGDLQASEPPGIMYQIYHSPEVLSYFLEHCDPLLREDLVPFLSKRHEKLAMRNLVLFPQQMFMLWRNFMLHQMDVLRKCREELSCLDIWSNVYDRRALGALCERLTAYFCNWCERRMIYKLEKCPVDIVPLQSNCQRDRESTMRLFARVREFAEENHDK